MVLRADNVAGGRVLDGFLGCSNCRILYPVAGGVADLRDPPRSRALARGRGVPRGSRARNAAADEALRLAALMGVVGGGVPVVVAGDLAGRAPELAALLADVGVVALAPRFDPDPPLGITCLMASARLPLADGSVAAIALAGSWAEGLIADAPRCLTRSGRLVILDASPEGERAFRDQSLGVLVDEAGVLVGRLR